MLNFYSGEGDGRGGHGGRGGRRGRGGSSSNNDNGYICFRCRVGNTELEVMGQQAAVRMFPFWCPLCGYIRNDRIGSQRLEVVGEGTELVLRPARQQPLTALSGQTLAVSPYASGPAQPPPTPAAPDAFPFRRDAVGVER